MESAVKLCVAGIVFFMLGLITIGIYNVEVTKQVLLGAFQSVIGIIGFLVTGLNLCILMRDEQK